MIYDRSSTPIVFYLFIRRFKMLLDTLKKFAFKNMNIQILKDNDIDYIAIENSCTEIHNRPDGGNATKIMRIVTKVDLDGEIVSSKIFETLKIRTDNGDKNSYKIIDKSSQEYSDTLPSLLSDTIQKSMELCSCDIPRLAFGDCINIDRFGEINLIRLCDRKVY